MKTFAFIIGLMTSTTAFAPFAVAKQNAETKLQKCGKDNPDHAYLKNLQGVPAPKSGDAKKANG